MSANPYGTGIFGLLKKGWVLIPTVMGASTLALLGLAMGTYGVYTNHRECLPPKYKMDFIIYRPDDPRAHQRVKE